MRRSASSCLDSWLASRDRKPLVLRDARQVGKTWLVRDLAQRSGRQLVELNLERHPAYAEHFRDNDPDQTLRNLAADLSLSLQPESSLLFLDEIQATPQLLASLRWFREDLPELPVIAAGSLLEFALRYHQFSMPVGRISYCHLGACRSMSSWKRAATDRCGKCSATPNSACGSRRRCTARR